MDEVKKKVRRPQWMCDKCGLLYGRWHQRGYTGPLNYFVPYHTGVCEICQEITTIAKAQNFGNTIRDWKYQYEINSKRTG